MMRVSDRPFLAEDHGSERSPDFVTINVGHRATDAVEVEVEVEVDCAHSPGLGERPRRTPVAVVLPATSG